MQEVVPGYDSQSLFGLFAPARTPAETIAKIQTDLAEIITRPDIKKLLAARNFDVQAQPGHEFQKIIEKDTTKWRNVITTANIKVD